MNEKHYCLECQKLIDEGKEVKIEKPSRNWYYNRSARLGWSHSGWTTYYLCPSCYKKQQAEMWARRDKDWVYALCIMGGIILIIFIVVIWFILWHRQYDRKVDLMVKKEKK